MFEPIPTHVVKTEIRDVNIVRTHSKSEPSHVIEARLAYLQVYEYDFYVSQARNQQTRLIDAPAAEALLTREYRKPFAVPEKV